MNEHEQRVVDGETTRATCGESTRTDRVVAWIGWHIGELLAVGVPLLLAVTVTVWAAGLAVLAGALWVVHEVRQANQRRVLRAPGPRRQLTSAGASEQTRHQTSSATGSETASATGGGGSEGASA